MTARATRGALLLLLLAGLAPPARPAEPRLLRVAVMAFDSVAEDPELGHLGVGLQAMLTTDLASAPSLQLVERDKLAAVQAELALGKTAAIDKATAVKVGKLLGASHLLTGAVTVVGETMRIDARLIDASTGEVALADKTEGQRELFFELEKTLAQKLVQALGAPLTPKERARLAKIHTADFDAFRRFSDGIEAFDEKAFDAARKALRDALERDQEFRLARLTLDDYEAIIARLAARSELLEAGQREQQARARTARGAEQKLILDRLFALADSKDADERLPALLALSRWHDRREAHDEVELHLSGDAFLIARTAEAFQRAYIAEAEKAFPKVAYFATRDFIGRPPMKAEGFEEEQRDWLERFYGKRRNQSEAQFKHELLEDLERGVSSRDVARALHLDARGEARLAARAFELGMSIDPDAIGAFFDQGTSWRRSFARTIGQRFREAGLFDESTRFFAESGRAAMSPDEARWAAEEVERNRDIVKFLAAHPSPRVREWMMMHRYDLPSERWEDEAVQALEEKLLGPKGRSILANARELRVGGGDAYRIIGDRPFYPLPGSFFSTGRRSDPFVAADLDYYRGKSRSASEEWEIGVFDGRHKGKLEARFALGYAPDAEWWHENLSTSAADLQAAGFITTRPEVLFLFGLEDIDVPLVEDPDDRRAKRLQRGMRGFGLDIREDRVTLVAVTQPEVRTGYSIARDRLSLEVLDADEGAIKEGAKVTLKLDGREVEARVGGARVSATLPRIPAGFTGLAFLLPGHVAIVAPQVTMPR